MNTPPATLPLQGATGCVCVRNARGCGCAYLSGACFWLVVVGLSRIERMNSSTPPSSRSRPGEPWPYHACACGWVGGGGGVGCAGGAVGAAVCGAVMLLVFGQKLCWRSISSVSLILASLVGLWRGFGVEPRRFMPVGFFLVGMPPVRCGRLLG